MKKILNKVVDDRTKIQLTKEEVERELERLLEANKDVLKRLKER